MTAPPPPYQYHQPKTGQACYFLEPQVDYDGPTPLYMVMRGEDDNARILAERCLLHDGITIVDALRLQWSIANWGAG
jgi:hypothetical protein